MIGVQRQSGVHVTERLCRVRSALEILAGRGGRTSVSDTGIEGRLNARASLRKSWSIWWRIVSTREGHIRAGLDLPKACSVVIPLE